MLQACMMTAYMHRVTAQRGSATVVWRSSARTHMPRERIHPLPYPALPQRIPHGEVPAESSILRFPRLAQEFNPQDNNGIPAGAIRFGSELPIIWYCATHDTKFVASPNWRTRVRTAETGERPIRTDCPGCLGTKRLDDTHPELVQEFVECVGQPLRPMCSLTSAADVQVTWRCKTHGLWRCVVWQRTSEKSRRCPGCVERDRAPRLVVALRPDLVAQWIRCESASSATPLNTTVGSTKLVWWRCEAGHDDWLATVSHRCSRAVTYCPQCIREGVRKLRDLPALMGELAADVNRVWAGALSAASEERLQWICQPGDGVVHRWTASVASRARRHKASGCPVCANQIVTPENSFAALAPDALKLEFDVAENPCGLMERITARSSRPVRWLCGTCKHRWTLAPAFRWDPNSKAVTKCLGCEKKVATVGYNLAIRHPAIAATWHPTKNAELTPFDVTPGSGRKVWWRCIAHPNDPTHDYQQRVYRRVEHRSGCDLCEITQTSLVQEIVTCELAWLLRTTAHALSGHSLQGWKGKFDIAFALPTGQRITIDYDSYFHHQGRSKEERDRRKHRLSQRAGDFPIRLRENGLGAIGDHDLLVAAGPQSHREWKSTMNALVRHLAELFPELLAIDDERVVRYLARERCVRIHEARDRMTLARRMRRRPRPIAPNG